MFNSRPVTGDIRAQQQQIEQRKQLVNCVRTETKTIEQVTAMISQQGEVNKKACIDLLEQSLAAVDRVLQGGDWESSLFLRNTIKPIKALREKIVDLQHLLLNEQTKQLIAPSIPAGKIPVYIALFQTEGLNLSRWAMQVRSLANYVQGRPVYRTETAVMQMIRSKLDSTNDAYIVIAISPDQIVNESTPRLDRNGSELLTLVDHAVRNSEIIEFVHQQKRYCWLDSHLLLQDSFK